MESKYTRAANFAIVSFIVGAIFAAGAYAHYLNGGVANWVALFAGVWLIVGVFFAQSAYELSHERKLGEHDDWNVSQGIRKLTDLIH